MRIYFGRIKKLSAGIDPRGYKYTDAQNPGVVSWQIDPKFISFYQQFFSNRNIGSYFQKGLLETHLLPKINNKVKAQQTLISPITYPFEWSRSMHKDAFLMFLNLCRALKQDGLMAQDTHSQNFAFKSGQPYFVDLGAIMTLEETNLKQWKEGLINFFIFPLFMFSLGESNEYRLKMRMKNSQGIDANSFLFSGKLSTIPRKLVMILKIRELAKTIKFANLTSLKKIVKTVNLNKSAGDWTGYYREMKIRPDRPLTWNDKQKSIVKIVKRCKPNSVLDLAGNTGLYLELAKHVRPEIKQTILVDFDEAAIDRGYLSKKFDVCVVAEFSQLNRPIQDLPKPYPIKPPLTRRLEADLTLVLALIHHLAFTEKMKFRKIVKILSELNTRLLAIEFIDRSDPKIQVWLKPENSWYTKKNFRKSIATKFNIIQVLPSEVPTRSIYLIKPKMNKPQ